MKKEMKKMTIEDLAAMTQRGFIEIKKNMATKEDLKRFATKEDLKRFATKEDLKRFATKEDITDLKEGLKNDINSLKEELKEILLALDKASGDYSNYREEKVVRDTEIARIKRWVEQIAKETGVDLKD